MKRDFVGTCPKDFGEPGSNEDQFAFSEDGIRLALSDGASESYNSRLWARIISQRFTIDPKFGMDWLAAALSEYIATHNIPMMSWSQQLAFERGSFATLLGVEYDPIHHAVDVLAIGDCIALLVDGDELVRAWPFTDPERFKEHPTLLATLPVHNTFIVEPGFWIKSVQTFHMDAYREPRLYCMTDALGEWALRHALAHTDGLARLSALTSQDELCCLVAEERAAKRMRVDDSTLIILSFGRLLTSDGVSVS